VTAGYRDPLGIAKAMPSDIAKALGAETSSPSVPRLQSAARNIGAQRALGNVLPHGALNALQRAGVTTLSNLTRVDNKSISGADPETMKRLRALKHLSTLTPDLNAAGRLVTAGYRDPVRYRQSARCRDILAICAATPIRSTQHWGAARAR
jgi:hypothetical protein